MKKTFESEIDCVALDYLLGSTRLCLGIAWKLTVLTLTPAIILGMTAGPAGRFEPPTSQASQPIRVETMGNLVQIFTQLPAGKDTLEFDLIDPLRTNRLHLTFDHAKLTHSFTQNAAGLQLGYAIRPGGGEILHIRTPRVDYNVELQGNRESKVIVVDPSENQRRIGEIAVSPEGKLRPSSNDADDQG